MSDRYNRNLHWKNVRVGLEWGTESSLKPKHPPGDGFRKLTQECIRRLVKRGEHPADDSLARWAGVEERR